MQITNGFWLTENTKETTKNQSDFSCFNNKIYENGHDFVQTTIWFCMQKPELYKKYVFLAKCIENAVLREITYGQQKWGKWAGETKQAAYSRLR